MALSDVPCACPMVAARFRVVSICVPYVCPMASVRFRTVCSCCAMVSTIVYVCLPHGFCKVSHCLYVCLQLFLQVCPLCLSYGFCKVSHFVNLLCRGLYPYFFMGVLWLHKVSVGCYKKDYYYNITTTTLLPLLQYS